MPFIPEPSKSIHQPPPMDPRKQQQQPISSTFISSPLLQPGSQRPKRRTWRNSSRYHEAPDPPRIDAHLQPKSMTLSLNSGPSSRPRPPQKQLEEAMTISCSSMDVDKKGASLSKCRSASGGFSGGRGGEGEAEEKRLVVAGDGGGGRRSFSGTKVEVGCVFAGLGARIVAKDMPSFMQIHAVTCARNAYDGLEKFSAKALAFTLKKEFDAVYGPAWHCIVGTSFGSFVTHSVGGFLYFSMDKLHVLLFKTSVQKSE